MAEVGSWDANIPGGSVKVRGESRARFLQELNETVTVWPPSRQTQVAQQTQGVLPTDLKWEFSSLSWLAPRLDSNPCPHPQRWLWGGYKRWHLPGLVKVVPAETSRGQRHREKTRLWLGATGDSQTLLHLQKLCRRWGLLVYTSESLFWRWEFEIEAINPGLSLPPQLFFPPQSQGINQTPSRELALLPVQSASSTPIRVCREVHLSGLLGAPFPLLNAPVSQREHLIRSLMECK